MSLTRVAKSLQSSPAPPLTSCATVDNLFNGSES